MNEREKTAETATTTDNRAGRNRYDEQSTREQVSTSGTVGLLERERLMNGTI